MKQSKTVVRLTWLTAVLVLIYTSVGLFWQDNGQPFSFNTLRGQTVQVYGQGLYRYDTVITALGFRGTDAAMLLVVLPLLVIASVLYRRGSLRGGLLLLGTLFACLYNALSLALGAAYNVLYLVYIAACSASFFAFVWAFVQVDLKTFIAHIRPSMPNRKLAAFMFVTGGFTAIMWLSLILIPLSQGQLPEALGSYTTIITFVIDLAIIVPAVMLIGGLLLKRETLGYVLTPIGLLLMIVVGLVMIGQSIFQLSGGIVFNPGQLIGLIGSWIVMGGIAVGLMIAYLHNVTEPTIKVGQA